MRNETAVKVAAVVTALAECDGWSPASAVYLAIGSNLDDYHLLTDVLARAGLIEKGPEVLRLTDKGFELARKIEAALAEPPAAAKP